MRLVYTWKDCGRVTQTLRFDKGTCCQIADSEGETRSLRGNAFPAGLGGLLLRIDKILCVRAFEIFNLATSYKMPDTGGDFVDHVVIVRYQ